MTDNSSCPFCRSTDPNKVGIHTTTGSRCRDPFHCPSPETHGNPFRYCRWCNWIESEEEQP